jgi:hypothetical protein
MLQLNAHQQSVLFENLTRLLFLVLSYEMLLNTIYNAMKLVLRSVNKQKKNEIYSQLMFFQRSHHSVIPILSSGSTTLSFPLSVHAKRGNDGQKTETLQ